MFDLLVASHPARQRSFGKLAAAVVLHAFLIGVAIEGTRQVAGATSHRVLDTTLFFALRPPPEQPPEPQRPPEAPEPDPIVVVDPPPKGFQTVVPPSEIPHDIPAIDLNQRALDPRNFTGRGVEGGIAGGVVGGTGKVDPATVSPGTVFVAADLDEPAQVIFQPQPRYPTLLQEAGIAGAVALQFVIGPQGKVEAASVEILESTDSAFVEPARESVLGSAFRPARFRGRAVRQLARQTIRFAIASR